MCQPKAQILVGNPAEGFSTLAGPRAAESSQRTQRTTVKWRRAESQPSLAWEIASQTRERQPTERGKGAAI